MAWKTPSNFNSYIIQPSVDALQEFKVQTGIYSAESAVAASQINVTTKSEAISITPQCRVLRNSALGRSSMAANSQEKKIPVPGASDGLYNGRPGPDPKAVHGKDRL